MPFPNRRFALLLRLYPADYRERYGREMGELLRREWEESGGGTRFWVGELVDHVWAAQAVRRRNRERGVVMQGGIGEDVRLALRRLWRAPLFTGFAVGTLGLGIGSAAGVFTVLERVVLRPLPYPASDRIVAVGSRFSHDPDNLGPLAADQLLELIEAPGPAEAVIGATADAATLTGLGDPERIGVNQVSDGFFDFLGAPVVLGRPLDARDQLTDAPRTVVLGYGFWNERFGADPGVLDRQIVLDDEAHTIVGVLGRDFVPPETVAGSDALWVPARFETGEASSGSFGIWALARLPDADRREAFRDYADARFTERYDFLLGSVVRDYRSEVIGSIGGRLGSAMGGVALLLLIACVNVASLTLTRVESLRQELAVRSALGASRGRLIRQTVTESGLLAAAGGVVGALVAYWAVAWFRTAAPPGLPRMAEVGVDLTGLGFAFVLGAATLVLFGVAPAVAGLRRVERGLAGMAMRTAGGRRGRRARVTLVLVETALAMVLIVGSGLLANDLMRLAREDTGFTPVGLTSMQVVLRGRVPGPEGWTAFAADLLEGAKALPGVRSAAITTQLPYDGVAVMQSLRPEAFDGDEGDFIATVSIDGDAFGAFGIEVIDGRAMTDGELASGAPVVVVNEAFVRRYWPDGVAVGRTVSSGDAMDEDVVTFTVVGVTSDVRTRPGLAVPPHVYLPLAAEPRGRMELVVLTEPGGPDPVPGLRGLVAQLDPGMPVGRIRSVSSVASAALDRPRFYTALFGGFAVVALVLALVGIYGTTAYVARSGMRDLGIRLALGAARPQLVGGVLAGTGRALLAGVLLGLGAAAVGLRSLSELLLYVTPHDVATYVGVGVLVLLTGTLAAWLPASRATRVDPVITLRQE